MLHGPLCAGFGIDSADGVPTVFTQSGRCDCRVGLYMGLRNHEYAYDGWSPLEGIWIFDWVTTNEISIRRVVSQVGLYGAA